MPHRKAMRRREDGAPRFITFSCHRRLPLLAPRASATIFADELASARARLGFALYAWVVMPEHVHLLLTPAQGSTAADVLASLKARVAKRTLGLPEVQRLAADPSCLWQRGGGFDRNVRDEFEFQDHAAYIHRNPVRRGLVKAPVDWEWSSARWYAGVPGASTPCDPPPFARVDWTAWRAGIDFTMAG